MVVAVGGGGSGWWWADRYNDFDINSTQLSSLASANAVIVAQCRVVSITSCDCVLCAVCCVLCAVTVRRADRW